MLKNQLGQQFIIRPSKNNGLQHYSQAILPALAPTFTNKSNQVYFHQPEKIHKSSVCFLWKLKQIEIFLTTFCPSINKYFLSICICPWPLKRFFLPTVKFSYNIVRFKGHIDQVNNSYIRWIPLWFWFDFFSLCSLPTPHLFPSQSIFFSDWFLTLNQDNTSFPWRHKTNKIT